MRRLFTHLLFGLAAAVACGLFLACNVSISDTRRGNAPDDTEAAPTNGGVADRPIRLELFERVLELNKVLEPELDEEAARAAYGELVRETRRGLADAPSPHESVERLNHILLTSREVSYLSRKYWRDSTLASSLLRMRGNCLSTSTLYFLVGDALGLPIAFVLVPDHAFVRWDDGQTQINVETVNGRVGFSDAEYEEHFSAPPQERAYYGFGESGDADALMLELLRIVAGHLEGQSRQQEAIAYLDRAIRIGPRRHDLRLQRARLRADVTGDRAQFRRELRSIMRVPGLPSSMHASLLCTLADEHGAEGDHQEEREALLLAYPIAPRYRQAVILTQLAFCHRALHDFRGAARYMELAEAFHRSDDDPARPTFLYNLAILQKNDHRLKDALASIDAGLACNPESWSLRILKAGYTVLDGSREEGIALFEELKDEKPRDSTEFYNIMLAWFYAASQQREKFYQAFGYALAQAKDPGILRWIDQDVDLDVYRTDDEFARLVAEHKARLLGKALRGAPSPNEAAAEPAKAEAPEGH
jgi:regulator of sirC expression with transglutaminase-like and TPR domain